jgi:hypothetical protein
VLPALDAAGARLVSQSSPEQTAEQAARLGLSRVPEVDAELTLSERFDPVAVPTMLLLDDGAERGRVEGLARDRMAALAAEAGATLQRAVRARRGDERRRQRARSGNRANLTIGRALQLTIRNVGGGRPRREDRAAHGGPGKVGFAFAERLDATAPWPGLAHARAPLAPEETGITVFAGEGPRFVVDQLAREPEALAAALAGELEHVASVRQRLVFDALLIVGPEHGRVFREAGWSHKRLQDELHRRTHRPAAELLRGAGGIADGLDPRWVDDAAMPVAKFAAPDRILLAYAGGDAGLFSMLVGGWASGELGSAPQTASVEPWR